MLIALFPNLSKPQVAPLALGIVEFLTTQGIEVVVEDKAAEQLHLPPLTKCDFDKIDFAISMGGDGTILRLLHSYPTLNAPIIGVNLGTLGFLAHIPVSEVYPSLQSIIDKNYTVQERMIMDGQTIHGDKCFAVNEIAFHRGKNPSLIDLAIHVDGLYLNAFSADGIIVSTASGSTAYSLSAGGPILTPDLEALVITPICPHTISNKPIVLMPKHEIQVQYLSEHQPIEIMFDGMAPIALKTGEMFHIQKSKRRFKLVCLPSHDYFATLRSKMGWTGTLKG